MNKLIAILVPGLASVLAAAVPAYSAESPPPEWAYPVNPPEFKPAPDDGAVRRVPGSAASYSLPQLRDRFLAPDWHPAEYPPMPEVVARGRKPDVFACGFCHRADGPGGPENASLAGLPAAYIAQQMSDYKSGVRKTSVPKRNIDLMISLAKAATDAEVDAAAAYFSSLKPKAIIRVVETDSVPKTYVAGWFLAAVKSGDKEALGQRIIEVPENLEQFEHRDTHARFIAYVPVGSIAKGEMLVKSGGSGKTIQCATCHGTDLKGVGAIPRIAGVSPSYSVRQLYDIKYGARAGAASAQMKDVVSKLSADDMVSIAAYLASQAP